jgi:hypothetical protein
MFFVLSVPFWLFVLIWIFTAPSRGRARRAAARELATTRELQTVAAMTEDMKAEYWERKRVEALAAYRSPTSNAKASVKMLVTFIGVMVMVVVIGVLLGH